MKLAIKLFIYGFFCAALAAAGTTVYWYYLFQLEPQTKTYSQGLNAVWARHDWVGKYFDEKEYRVLGEHCRRYHITDIYFHVGPLNGAGQIEPEKYPYAERLVAMMKKDFPEINLHAWIGQIEKSGGGPLDLTDTLVRIEITRTARIFLNIGFDGIHYNIEPLYTGNLHFINLLEMTQQFTSARNKILSVAGEKPEPFPGANALARRFMRTAGFWKISYYQQVSQLVDQIAVMMYDTAIPYNWVYSALVRRQTRYLLTHIDHQTILFMGVPSYARKSRGFYPEAENVYSATKGIQWGVQSIPQDRLKTFGIAIYANWTTDEHEWEILDRKWLRGQSLLNEAFYNEQVEQVERDGQDGQDGQDKKP